jgi:hypothetical protein
MINLSKITSKQREIMGLLYQYRFLNRIQIQAFLRHKDKKTVNVWLKDLKAKGYIDWIYEPDDFALKTKPAIYYLSLNSIRHLKDNSDHPQEELRKRYRESTRSQSFIDRSILIADACLALDDARDETSYPQSWYFYETEAEYLEDSYYHFILESELIKPQLCFQELNYDIGEPVAVAQYFLEIFDPGLPRYRMKKRLSNYIEYLDDEGEQWKKEERTDKLPNILMICPRTSDLIYAKRRTRGLIAEIWDEEDDEKPTIKFATMDDFKKRGVLGDIWEEA